MKTAPLILLLPLTAFSLPNLAPSQKHLQAMAPPDKVKTTNQPAVPLSDILGTHRSLTTFTGLANRNSPIASLLSSPDGTTTVLAPSNSAVEGLPRKPWEGGQDTVGTYEGEAGRKRADENLLRFVRAHLVESWPWKEGGEEGYEGGEGSLVGGEGGR